MVPFFTGPNKRGVLVILAFLAALCIVALFAKALAADTPAEMHGEQESTSQASQHVDKVKRIMLNFAAEFPRHPVHRQNYRQNFSECIVRAATKKNLEIEWLSAIVQRESSFRTTVSRGLRGEIGVSQVHPGTARMFKCEMKTVQGQLDCGATVLRYGIDKCGSIEGGLSVYASRGRCNPKPGTKLDGVVKARMKLIREMENM